MRILIKDAIKLISENGSRSRRVREPTTDIQKTDKPDTRDIIKCLELRSVRAWNGWKQPACNENTCKDFSFCQKLKKRIS